MASIQTVLITLPYLWVQIQDMVAIRHSGSHADQRTTLILLCEDGSLRIYMANPEHTSFWLSPTLQPQNAISILKPVRKKKAPKAGQLGISKIL